MKDRQGTKIKENDIVACAVTINHRRFSESFTVKVCKKDKRGRLILDGVWGWGYLEEQNPNELQIITKDVDLRKLCSEWIREFGEHGYDRIAVRTEDAHNFLEEVCELINHSLYDGEVDIRKEKAFNTIKAIVNKSIEINGAEKIRKMSEIISDIAEMRDKLTNSFEELRGL